MKQLYFFSTLFLLTSSVYAQVVFKPRATQLEYLEFHNDEIIVLKTPQANLQTFTSKLPYPIIFVHGLNSSSDTWNTSTNYFDNQYNFTFGGRLDYCLNADSNNVLANTDFYPVANADIAAFSTNFQNGDYYYVNFNLNPDGTIDTNVLSNQAAVTKQGAAMKDAVQRVLQITGKDKVILVGHSMGGLASREYLQNTNNWQADNLHHVAKLLTLGTPHGGSNASDNPLAFFTSVNVRSEAIRDLKETYYYSGEPSVYLFGGTEIQNSSSMNDNSYSPDFYNVDINCNGVTGESIIGLNQKVLDNYIDFSCVIGRITGGTTDGVVAEPSSLLNTYITGLLYPAKYFYFNSSFDFIENHTELPGKYYQILQGLDEPNYKELAYGISTNQNYIGFTTVQANSGTSDIDYFKFTVSDNVNATVDMSSIVTSNMNAAFLDANGNLIGSAHNNSGSTLNFTETLSPGNYFLRITSVSPSTSNYQTPYQFAITTVLDNKTFNTTVNSIQVYPNPTTDLLTIYGTSIDAIMIYDISGKNVYHIEFTDKTPKQTIDVSSLKKGIYFLTLEQKGQKSVFKILKE
ncbi:esterase [Flavobacterium sediminis]|uniref:Esterase n=1 Tax=Flavobacterium sediminis TaxID=2201181 RepID=A0A2U8QR08_9FLAO|nr:alpha/beta fold hydrolase [Flavobacterium sediminis]AWM12520.1 esterase [Flavobacterium sediminis]